MKKIVCALLLAVIVPCSAFATVNKSAKVGFLSRLNVSEEEFTRIVQDSRNMKGWHIITDRHDMYGVKFHDSLNIMQMAMNRREIDEIALPEVVAEYLLANNNKLEACCVARTDVSIGLALGFRKDSATLAAKFEQALQAMKDDWSLAKLHKEYINSSGNMPPVKFDTFKGAKTIRVAVTGDMPPIDYIDEAGEPAGFNAAFLAELGRHMKVNMKLVNTETGARTAALISGRVDVVLWYETAQDGSWNVDAPEEVLLSKPYYSWDKFLHVRRK